MKEETGITVIAAIGIAAVAFLVLLVIGSLKESRNRGPKGHLPAGA